MSKFNIDDEVRCTDKYDSHFNQVGTVGLLNEREVNPCCYVEFSDISFWLNNKSIKKEEGNVAELKVGDRVKEEEYGYGNVDTIDNERVFGVCVIFDNGYRESYKQSRNELIVINKGDKKMKAVKVKVVKATVPVVITRVRIELDEEEANGVIEYGVLYEARTGQRDFKFSKKLTASIIKECQKGVKKKP